MCSNRCEPQGIAPHCCDDGHASLEWKAGIDGRRTHLRLGFELRAGRPPAGSGTVDSIPPARLARHLLFNEERQMATRWMWTRGLAGLLLGASASVALAQDNGFAPPVSKGTSPMGQCPFLLGSCRLKWPE